MKLFAKNNLLLIYYTILMLVLVSWTSMSAAPPTVLRIAFLCAVIIPAIKLENGLLPAVLLCFWTTTQNGYAYSYMPTSEYIYAILMIVALVVGHHTTSAFSKDMRIWWGFLIYVTLLNFVTNFEMTQLSYLLLIVILFTFFIRKETLKDAIDLMSIAFMVLTIVISFYTLTSAQNIVLQDITDQGRTSWVDPNYMGMQIGIGGLIGVMNLFKYKRVNLLQKILSPIAVAVSLPAILMTGSRGAALCIVCGVAIMLFSSNTKLVYKILIVLVVGLFVLLLYNNDYFDLLLARIQGDDGSGSGRTDIWKLKLNTFMDANPLCWIFGCGAHGAATLGSNNIIVGFHNDYLNILCSYGIVGLSMFMSILIGTIKNTNLAANSKSEVFACILYVLMAMLTLEPFALGVIAFWSFMLYILLKSKYSWEEDE